jgi:nitroreductase
MFKARFARHSLNMQAPSSEAAQWAAHLIQSRRTTLPKRLCGPGPDAEKKVRILEAAAAAPDHDQLLPWRLIEVPGNRRASLGEAFVTALLERDPQADDQACAQAREKAFRSPWLLLIVVRISDDNPDIPAAERILSAGAAIQNMLLLTTAYGLGSALTSGKALQSRALRELFDLQTNEQALCFINVGHISEARKPRPRPEVARYFSKGEATRG